MTAFGKPSFFVYTVPEKKRKERGKMNFHLLRQYLDSLNEEYGIPALDVIVTKDHETVFRHMAGFADAEGTRPVSEKDFYLMYSCTKVITMTAMMLSTVMATAPGRSDSR